MGSSNEISDSIYREAKVAAYLWADARKSGRTLHVSDLLIAATSPAHELASPSFPIRG